MNRQFLASGVQMYLREAYRGYRAVVLVEKIEYQWMVEILGSGTLIMVYEDELEF